MHTYVSVSGVSLNYEEQYSNDGLRNNYGMRLKVSTTIWDNFGNELFCCDKQLYLCICLSRKPLHFSSVI